jgi:hypothetical protein
MQVFFVKRILLMALPEHPRFYPIPISTHAFGFRMQKTAAAGIQAKVWQKPSNTAIRFLSIHQYFTAHS